MGVNKYVIAGLVIIIVIGGVAVFSSTLPGSYDEFAQCLTDKGAKMYGAYWCTHCASQKKEFGNSLKYVDYVECDPSGADANPQLCQQKGIKGYPTWEINGQFYEGEQNFQTLSALSGCPLTGASSS
ncbi:MAG: hypothetical protein ABH863_06475 [Candidatus Micrarchaeota archaeon]